MRLIRAGLWTTLVLALLASAALTGFGSWYASYDRGDIIERVMLWFLVSTIGFAPVALIVFPVMHKILGMRGGTIRAYHFALAGAICGVFITALALWKFRSALFGATVFTYAAVPLLVLLGAVAGFIGGLFYELLARRGMKHPEQV